MLIVIKSYLQNIAITAFIIYLIYSFLCWDIYWMKDEVMLRASSLVILTIVLCIIEINRAIKKERLRAKPGKMDYPY